MENGNEPINPVYFKDGELNCLGLTKREYFASLAMQGMLANNLNVPNTPNVEYVARLSVIAADELLKQLNDEQ